MEIIHVFCFIWLVLSPVFLRGIICVAADPSFRKEHLVFFTPFLIITIVAIFKVVECMTFFDWGNLFEFINYFFLSIISADLLSLILKDFIKYRQKLKLYKLGAYRELESSCGTIYIKRLNT
jgi:hypothetical protein